MVTIDKTAGVGGVDKWQHPICKVTEESSLVALSSDKVSFRGSQDRGVLAEDAAQ